MQEGESLTALKGILAKVAPLLKPLQLTSEESTRLVERMYGDVLDMDSKLAGESDETRKALVLEHIQNAAVRRDKDRKLVLEYQARVTTDEPKPAAATTAGELKPAKGEPRMTATTDAAETDTTAAAEAEPGEAGPAKATLAGAKSVRAKPAQPRAARTKPKDAPAEG